MIIPENYYAIGDKDACFVLKNIISCMGISITTHSNAKICLHHADIAGFPVRKVFKNKHPLPNELQANNNSAHLVFDFLFRVLNVAMEDIKHIVIFGNYQWRYDVFPQNKVGDITPETIIKYMCEAFKCAPHIWHHGRGLYLMMN